MVQWTKLAHPHTEDQWLQKGARTETVLCSTPGQSAPWTMVHWAYWAQHGGKSPTGPPPAQDICLSSQCWMNRIFLLSLGPYTAARDKNGLPAAPAPTGPTPEQLLVPLSSIMYQQLLHPPAWFPVHVELTTLIIGDSIVRHVNTQSSTTFPLCFPSATVYNISARIPEILEANDIRRQQLEI